MLKKTFPAIEFATLAITVFLMAANVAEGASSPGMTLTGQVSSQEEGRMGGVLVSAKREGSTVTTTVVSDAQGKYSFPTAKLEPGQRTGKFRLGGDQLLVDANGESRISVQDYAVAMIDELERPAHIRQRFTVGY